MVTDLAFEANLEMFLGGTSRSLKGLMFLCSAEEGRLAFKFCNVAEAPHFQMKDCTLNSGGKATDP